MFVVSYFALSRHICHYILYSNNKFYNSQNAIIIIGKALLFSFINQKYIEVVLAVHNTNLNIIILPSFADLHIM